MGNVYRIVLNLKRKEKTTRSLPTYTQEIYYIQAKDSDDASEKAKDIAFSNSHCAKIYNKDESFVISCEFAYHVNNANWLITPVNRNGEIQK